MELPLGVEVPWWFLLPWFAWHVFQRFPDAASRWLALSDRLDEWRERRNQGRGRR